MAVVINPGAVVREDDSLIEREEGRVTLADAIENVFDYKWLFGLVFAISVLIAVVRAITAVPIYSAESLVRLKGGGQLGGALSGLSGVAPSSSPASFGIAGEIETIRARSTISRAVDALLVHTEIAVRDRLPVFGEWLAGRLPRNADGLVEPPLRLLDREGRAWGGEQLRLGRFSVPPQRLGQVLVLRAEGNDRWTLLDASGEELARGVVGKPAASSEPDLAIEVERLRARPGTRFSVVRHSSANRANQMSAGLFAQESQRGSGVIRITFSHPDADFAQRMANAIADAYITQNASERAEEVGRSITFIDSQLPLLRADLDRAEFALNSFRIRERAIDMSESAQQLSRVATDLERQRVEIDLRRREMIDRYEPEHPQMKALERQATALAAATRRVEGEIARLPLQQQEFLRLTRDVAVVNQLYSSLLNSAQQLRITKAGTVASVTVVDYAMRPGVPSRPNRTRIVSIGVLIGIALGIAAAQFAAIALGRVRDPRRLERETGLATAAILPFVPQQAAQSASGDTYLLAHDDPSQPAVEALRSLRIHVELSAAGVIGPKVIVVTSAVPAQGKSFVSSNLAYLLAASGKRVLLIDGDLRRPSLPAYVGGGKEQGLTEVLAARPGTPTAPMILSAVKPNLDVLPAGSRVRQPAELLSSPRLAELFDWAGASYDFVVVDAPPILPVSDAALLARHATEVLFVVRQKQVARGEVDEALAQLHRFGSSPTGLVYNCYVPSAMRYGYGRRYGYYRYRYKYDREAAR